MFKTKTGARPGKRKNVGLFGRIFGRRVWEPLPDSLWTELSGDRPCLHLLAEADAQRLRRLATWFMAKRRFVPVGGAEPSELDKATIAALACLPILNLGTAWYRLWSTVLLEPDGFIHRMETVDDAGVVTEYDDELAGRVTELGPIILSLRDVRESGHGDGYDVVVHEMAHKLDERDGGLDGVPPLPGGISRAAWRAVFSSAFEDFRARAGSRRLKGRRRSLPLDEYAADSPEEFFAVSCEHFFGTPSALARAYPELYGLLSSFFRQDPKALGY
ncbi:MAG TPA: zinc-dependent peptidase [Spirochaetales bacterium]|nr:zinc-dependent peptidase [Spirochaetales bacterium]